MAQSDENVFYVSCEDGLVYNFDLRTSMSPCGEFAAFSNGSKTLALSRNLLVVGGNKPYVNLFDIRMENKKVSSFGSGSLAETYTHVTDVRFNPAGTELLVNVGNDNVYLFDVNSKQHTEFTLPDITQDQTESPKLSEQLEELKTRGNEAFREGEYWFAEQLYNYGLYRAKNHPVLLANSSAALVERKYPGDLYHGFRQARLALQAIPQYIKCRKRAIKILKQLKLWAMVFSLYFVVFRLTKIEKTLMKE